MILSDVMNRIKFKAWGIDDISSHNTNALISNSNILYELNAQMINYAVKTKGMQDIYSVSVTSNDQFISGPTYALRSGAYLNAYLTLRGWMQPLAFKNQRDVRPIFRVAPVKSMGSWLMVFNEGKTQRIFMYPMPGTSYNTTTLTAGINSSVATIPVASTASFIATNGRITIGTEKILYQYKDATNFYGCVRGVEGTTAASALQNATVKENNLIINYARMPVPFTVTDTPDSGALATDLGIVEDHVEGIVLATAAPLCFKVDPTRSTTYQAKADQLFEQYRMDIGKGYSKASPGTMVRDPYIGESGIPMDGNRF